MIGRALQKKSVPLKNHRTKDKPVVIYSHEFFENSLVLSVDENVPFAGISIHFSHKTGDNPCYFKACRAIADNGYLIAINHGNIYTLFFALTHAENYVSFEGCLGGVLAKIYSAHSENIPAVIVLEGENLYAMFSQVMELALKLTGGSGHLVENKLSLPKWFNAIGWATGMSLGNRVSHENILDSVLKLAAKGIVPSYLLIDEGWQDCFEGRLNTFRADKTRFPDGLKGVVDDLQKIGVKHVGVWHALKGARLGLSHQLSAHYNFSVNQTVDFLGKDFSKTFQFYYDYYNALRQEGISFVKVGFQSVLASFNDKEIQGTEQIKNFQTAIQAASSVQFDSFPFNADCLSNGNFFYWSNSRMAAVAGLLDDDNPVGIMIYIRNTLINSLWVQPLMQPDFSVWSTSVNHSKMLAVLHALCGSVNIIGDQSETLQQQLLQKVILPSGKILQADQPLTVCEESIFKNPLEEKHIFKAFTTKGKCGVIAAFNLCQGQKSLHGFISPKDVAGLKSEVYGVYSHNHGFLGTVGLHDSIPIVLKPAECDVFTFSAVKHGVAVFGCHHFFLCCGTLLEVDEEEDSVHMTMLVSGPLLLYVEKKILEVRCNGQTVPWELDAERRILSIDSKAAIIESHATYCTLFES